MRYSKIMFRSDLVPILCGVLFAGLSSAQVGIPTPPAVDARSYILVEHQTGKILAAKDALARIEPASLTKLMTAYIVFRELRAGKLKLDDPVTISEKAWRSEGSRTFIDLGSQVPARILIMGMIVQSGNDATIALAERIAGTEQTFVQLMNSNATRLGMTGTHFDNSSGLPSAQHYSTARDISLLANAIIREYPEYYSWYSVREFEFHGIKQQNRNGLLGRDPSVDGMKTGHTDTAGYCLVTSAKRDGMRLVSVVLGSASMKAREDASAALVNYGFTFYESKFLAKGGSKLGSTAVWKADRSPVDIGISGDLYAVVPRGHAARLKLAVDIKPTLIAPLSASAAVGELRVILDGQTVASRPVHALQAVGPGGLWRRAIDSIKMWFN
jgi:serine-type D-Ala-D-Ala carboxypeptidase (penicillin-binding protein 5/6)